MVEAPGLEPRLKEPKSFVLPLYYASIKKETSTAAEWSECSYACFPPQGSLFSTGSKIRTLINGFGDHYVTFTPNLHKLAEGPAANRELTLP